MGLLIGSKVRITQKHYQNVSMNFSSNRVFSSCNSWTRTADRLQNIIDSNNDVALMIQAGGVSIVQLDIH